MVCVLNVQKVQPSPVPLSQRVWRQEQQTGSRHCNGMQFESACRAVNWVAALLICIFSDTLARKSDNSVAPSSARNFTSDLPVKTHELDLD
jgi:hypothetical protein